MADSLAPAGSHPRFSARTSRCAQRRRPGQDGAPQGFMCHDSRGAASTYVNMFSGPNGSGESLLVPTSAAVRTRRAMPPDGRAGSRDLRQDGLRQVPRSGFTTV
jgi:hypothetical protein